MYIAYLAWAMVCSSRALQLHEITSNIQLCSLVYGMTPGFPTWPLPGRHPDY